DFETRASEALGSAELLSGGMVPGRGFSYSTAYRLAELTGIIRARWLFRSLSAGAVDEDPADRYALRAAVDVLDLEQSLPRELRTVRKAFARLRSTERTVRKRDWIRIWYWLNAFFHTVVGGFSECIMSLAYKAKTVELATSSPVNEDLALQSFNEVPELLA